MNDWPGEKELRLYQRLIAFFAEPAARQQELLQDFTTEQSYDMYEGHIRTRYPLTICVMSLRYWTAKFTDGNYNDMASAEFLEIGELARIIEDAMPPPQYMDDNWSAVFWSVSHLSEPGVWSILRRLCAAIMHKLPAGELLVEGEIAKLLNDF